MKTLFPAEWLGTNDYRDTETVEKYGMPCPYFRKEFLLMDKPVAKAELYASAVGVFKAYINGEETDDDYMSPGYTDYRIRLPWMRYDVKHLLKAKNAIVLVAGDGWAVGYMGNAMHRHNYYRNVCVCAKLVIEYTDGEKQLVMTDLSWKYDTDEIMRTDNYVGEVINHNMAKDKRFYLPDYDYSEGNWREPKIRNSYLLNQCLSEEIAPRIKVMHRLSATLIRANARHILYDFEQNFTGNIRLKVRGERGTKITAKYGEMLEEDGRLYTENLRRAECTDEFILKGDGSETFRPLFTFHGFRYVELRITGKAEIEQIEGEVMYSALDKSGEFSCSDSVVNRIYQNAVWGQRSNFLSVPTDCPQRDERLGWTGDAQIFCGTAMFNMDCDKFYRKYIQDLIDSQRGDGGISGIAPHVPHTCEDYVENGGFTCAAGWGDAMTVIPYEHYLMYGDKRYLKDVLYFVKKFVRMEEAWSDDLIRPAAQNWGDWLNVNCETDKSLLSTAYFAFSSMLTAKMCEITGDEDKDYFENLHVAIRKAFRNKFLNDDGTLTSHTQTAYLLAYASKMMTAQEVREPLMQTIHAADDKLTTGFLGVKFLLPTLCDLGEVELAYKILCNTEYPGWGYSVMNGATTMWERWNSYTKEHGFGDVNMNSFNHYSFGSVAEWMYKYCLGINPVIDGAGFEKVLLRPYPDTSGAITHAEGYYDSKKGKISVSWKREAGKTVYCASVPKEIDLVVQVGEDVETKITRY